MGFGSLEEEACPVEDRAPPPQVPVETLTLKTILTFSSSHHLIVGERMRAEGCVSSSAPGAMHLMLKIKTSFEAPKVHNLLVIGTPVRI